MNKSVVCGTVVREPFYRSASEGKKAWCVVTVETGDTAWKTRHDAQGYNELAEEMSNVQEGDVVYVTGSHALDNYNKDFVKLRLNVETIRVVGRDITKEEQSLDEVVDDGEDF